MDLCQTHFERGLSVPADLVVDETPMCRACFAGRAVFPEERQGDSGDERVRDAGRRYLPRKMALRRRRRAARLEMICSIPAD